MKTMFPIPNTQEPNQGPKGLLAPLLFATRASIVVSDDTMVEQQSGAFEGPQCAWIDNRQNTQAVAVTFLGLNYTLQVRAGRQGLFPVLVAAGVCRWTAAVANNAQLIDVPMVLVNQNMGAWFMDV